MSVAVGGLADELAPVTPLARIQRVWPAAVGELLAANATPIRERDGVVTLLCEQAVWMAELTLMAPDLAVAINEQLDAALVRELRCVATPG